ncbi:hypothetical protein L1S35_12620 [Flavobacterium sp. AS60]|uniref:hypothetical protein n=1 Tax=Flavobacterium anseongense TaxID=2910677 RepID=UPI001F1BB177|nr:hypothetical protein [Flavobacterium sp. AS60]MCF6130521.1 hypothetical protein [Flavobacterium sp. AS60]
MVKDLRFNFIRGRRYCGILLYCAVIFCSKINATTFYVNDNSIKGDIYTTAIGNDSNDGISPDNPKLTILSAYKIAKEGDTIIVDIGNYNEISLKGELSFENTKKIKFLIAGFSDEIYSKTSLPINEKVSPAIFYIKDDKPIDREAYLRNLQNSVDKK